MVNHRLGLPPRSDCVSDPGFRIFGICSGIHLGKHDLLRVLQTDLPSSYCCCQLICPSPIFIYIHLYLSICITFIIFMCCSLQTRKNVILSFGLNIQSWAIKILHTINVEYKYNHHSFWGLTSLWMMRKMSICMTQLLNDISSSVNSRSGSRYDIWKTYICGVAV